MKKIELFIHVAHCAEPKAVSIGEDAVVADLAKVIMATELLQPENGAEVLVFGDNEDEPLDHNRRLCESGVGRRRLLHCHRCHRVEVKVHYNGAMKERGFPPSARVSRVLKWAAGAFGLTGADAQGLELRLQGHGNDPLPSDSHIGCYTRPHVCAVDLALVAKVRVEG